MNFDLDIRLTDSPWPSQRPLQRSRS